MFFNSILILSLRTFLKIYSKFLPVFLTGATYARGHILDLKMDISYEYF